MRTKLQFSGTINACLLPYIVNNDPSGLDPDDVEAADLWVESIRRHVDGQDFCLSFNPDEDPYFGADEATGLMASVVTYTCTVFED